jgi:hypothetical protein
MLRMSGCAAPGTISTLLSSPRNLSQLGNRALSKHGYTINMAPKKKTSKAKGGAKSEPAERVHTEPAPADPKAANAPEMAPPVEKEGAIKWAIRLLMDKEARMDYARETFKKHDVDGSGGMDVDEMCGLITVCTHAHVVADDGAL